MKISVIIPCYNASRWIGEAIASVVAQALADLEVLVIDDGSTDGSATIVQQAYPAARLVSIRHAGPSQARNVGARLASGIFIQYLDADDQLASGKLTTQLEALECSGADVAYGDWQELVEQAQGGYALGRKVARQIQGPAELALFTDFWCPPAAYLFRREIVEKIGGWNEQFPVIQDARFALDCALRGGRFIYCPGIMAYYRRHSGGSLSQRDSKAFVRDCLLNAQQVETWWQQHGGLDAQRRRALLAVLQHVVRASTETADHATFEIARQALQRLDPEWRPPHLALALASRLIGYARAERLAAWAERAIAKASRAP